jgi:PPIC-type PPIASE domain
LSSQSSQSTAVADDASPSSANSAGASVSSANRWSGLLREPLLHFLVLGAIIFAVNAVVAPSVSKERLIELTPEVRQSIIDVFQRNHEGREPTADELAPLVDGWILNEITYREALAQGLDKGDEMIRERIMQKMRLLIFGSLNVDNPTDAELLPWFEARRVRYDIPDLVSFYEVPIGGLEAEEEARAILAKIEAGEEPEEVRLRAHIFKDRPLHSLEQAFGRPFLDALTASPIAKWSVLPSSAGWHIVRIDAFRPGRKVELREVATQVIAQWKDERTRIQAIAAIRDLGKSYAIRREP